jgi:hypothetical protein
MNLFSFFNVPFLTVPYFIKIILMSLLFIHFKANTERYACRHARHCCLSLCIPPFLTSRFEQNFSASLHIRMHCPNGIYLIFNYNLKKFWRRLAII